tara:strand:+ start:331 stop:741 length:411 start_codon:yes stop_codon:yes gene_type:complete
MAGPFKMKYTNGKKADSSSFPFKRESPQPGDSPADFNWEAALGGAGKGAATGSMLGPWGAVAGGVIGGVMSGIKGDESEPEQEGVEEEQITDEQRNRSNYLRARNQKNTPEFFDRTYGRQYNEDMHTGVPGYLRRG